MSETGATYGFSTFAELVKLIGSSTKTNEKLNALVRYFNTADPRDKVWVIAIFSGRRPRRSIKTAQLVKWCLDLTAIPEWLFAESYHTVGDLGETLALLIPDQPQPDRGNFSLHSCLEQLQLRSKDEQAQEVFVKNSWLNMNMDERFVFNKLITGNFRIGVSQQMMVNALADTLNEPASLIAHRISGHWDPFNTDYSALLGGDGSSVDLSKPYPFYLAYALDSEPGELGPIEAWQAEWKWDGIRGQIILREGKLFVWSRGEELMTDKFPEYSVLKDILPSGTVLDGEILCMWSQPDGHWKALPFASLQTRIGRKTITGKHLKDSPVGFIAYDILEYGGEDYRTRPLNERRRVLERIVAQAAHGILRVSPVIEMGRWQQLADIRLKARENGSEGLMLKRLDSVYQAGRKRGDWYKWKIDPLTIDGVMIYAQKGHGRRSNLFTDYTFAVRDGEKLVSFAKAYSGLTDKEFLEVDAFVKSNALEKFGPVRTVKPELVFEIAFEGISASSRHKSGVALRFPRINRWRKDKPVSDINTIEDLKKMLERYGK
jgi:DNA ligase-1